VFAKLRKATIRCMTDRTPARLPSAWNSAHGEGIGVSCTRMAGVFAAICRENKTLV